MAKPEKSPDTGNVQHAAGWQHFPEFEKVLTENPPPILARVEKTCRQLNDLVQAGSEDDKQRARLAMTAYGRSLELFRVLCEARDKAGQQS
jgi:hypothetical protein